jgi:hypothetical protein
MNRWIRAALAAALTLSVAHAVLAQGIVRETPKDVRPARMSVTLPPDITLDGKADRLSPGARIRNVQNLVVMSGSLAGTTVPVVYRRDSAGLVHEVWMLTDDEYVRLSKAAQTDNGSAFGRLLDAIFGTRQ